MPLKKPKPTITSQLIESLFNGESSQLVYAEIAYLKKRIHLVEGERKANYELNEDTLKLNESKLAQLKQTQLGLKNTLLQLAKTSGNYSLIVSHRIGNEKQTTNLKNKTLEDTIEIIECKIGDLKNRDNLNTFKASNLQVKQDQLEEDDLKIHQVLTKDEEFPSNPRLRQLQKVENSTALMEMKIIEAENIRARYKHMIDILHKENYIKEIQMAELKIMDGKHLKEISSLKQTLDSAERSKTAAKAKLTESEQNTVQQYANREQSLMEHRHRLKQIRDKMESIGAKLTFPKFHMAHRDSSASEGLYSGIISVGDQESQGGSPMEILYQRLSEMTGESDPTLIVARFVRQREHLKELELEEKEAKAEVRRCKIRKRFLQDKVNNIHFSGGLRRETLDERTGSILKEMDLTAEQRMEADKQIAIYGTIMEEALTKLYEICVRNGIKIPQKKLLSSEDSVQEYFIGYQILDVFKRINARLESVFEENEVQVSSATTAEGDEVRSNADDLNLLSSLGKPGDIYNKNLADLRLGAAVEESMAVSVRRLSVIDLISNDGGDIVGRNITTAEFEGFAELKEYTSPVPPLAGLRSEDLVPKLPGRSDTSDEEEAVSRVAIKKQSVAIIESKTRKGRYNPGLTLPQRRRP